MLATEPCSLAEHAVTYFLSVSALEHPRLQSGYLTLLRATTTDAVPQVGFWQLPHTDRTLAALAGEKHHPQCLAFPHRLLDFLKPNPVHNIVVTCNILCIICMRVYTVYVVTCVQIVVWVGIALACCVFAALTCRLQATRL